MELVYSGLPVSPKTARREVTWGKGDGNGQPGSPEEISRDMATLLSPRGLCFLRAVQREMAISIASGTLWETEDLGRIFLYNPTRVMGSLYASRDGGCSFSKRDRDQHDRFLRLLTSPNISFESQQELQEGDCTRTYGPLFKMLSESEISRLPDEIRETMEESGGQCIPLCLPRGAADFFTAGGRFYRAWGDTGLLRMDLAVAHPYGVLVQDFAEEQLNTGWSRYGGRGEWSLNRILGELGLRDHFLCFGGDPGRPKPQYRKNRWVRRLIRDLEWVSRYKVERGLWAPVGVKDSHFHRDYMGIPDFMQWMRTPAGKRALRIRRRGKDGALRFMIRVEAGNRHELRLRRNRPSARRARSGVRQPPDKTGRK